MGKSTIFVGAAIAICLVESNCGVASLVDRMNLTGSKIAPSDFLDKYDHKLRQFAKLFANSSTGKLLKEVVEDLAAYPAKRLGVDIDSAAAMRQPVYYPEQVPVVKAYRSPLEGLSTGSPQQSSVILAAYISALTILALIPFSLFAVFGAAQNMVVYTWCAIIGYAAATVALTLFFGLIPPWMLFLLSMILGVVGAYTSYKRPTKEVVYGITFFACMLAATTIYSLLAGIPYPQISPAFCGLAGLIFDTGFAGKNYMVLKLLYLAFVFIIAGLLFLSIPSYVLAKEPQTAQEREFATTCTRYIVCFVCAWIVSGGIMQLIYLLGAAFNPLDPASTFFVPSQFRLNTWETYVALAIWSGLTYGFVQLRKQYEQDSRFDPQLISQEVKEQWKLVTSQ